jgi:uncharacterized integral membrane protein
MAKLKKVVLVLLIIVSSVVGAWVALENSSKVSAMFFGFPVDVSLGTLVLLCFVFGGLLGIAVSLVPYFLVKAQVKILNRKIHGYEKEIAKLRTAPLRS